MARLRKRAEAEPKVKTSLRERNIKAAEDKQKPKRIRKAAGKVGKPVGKIKNVLTSEYHITPRKNKDGFFTRSRSLTPRYIKNSFSELRQVTWPGRKETWKLVFAVYVFAISMGIFIALLDFGLEKLFRQIIL